MKGRPNKKKAKPASKRKPQPEPRAAAPVEMPGPDEVVKTPDLPVGGATEEDLDDEVESIGDGTEEGDDVPPEVDDEDDEGYF